MFIVHKSQGCSIISIETTKATPFSVFPQWDYKHFYSKFVSIIWRSRVGMTGRLPQFILKQVNFIEWKGSHESTEVCIPLLIGRQDYNSEWESNNPVTEGPRFSFLRALLFFPSCMYFQCPLKVSFLAIVDTMIVNINWWDLFLSRTQ